MGYFVSGMEVLNVAINKVCQEIPEDQWAASRIEVAVSTITVTGIKVVFNWALK